MVNMRSEKIKKSIKENTTRVNLNVPNEIDKVYKELAYKRGISKTSMILYAMSWFYDYHKSLDILPKLMTTLTSIEEK